MSNDGDEPPQPRTISLEELQAMLDGRSAYGRVESAQVIEVIEQQVLADGTVLRRYTKVSPITGETNRMILAAAPDAWAAYDAGEMVQRALPHLTAAEREFLISGITAEEWQRDFPEQDDEPEDEPEDEPGR
jgi:hypothetical protein